jgi:hypothetical protein
VQNRREEEHVTQVDNYREHDVDDARFRDQVADRTHVEAGEAGVRESHQRDARG